MGVFSGNMPEQTYAGRDYEGDINRLRAQIKAASTLFVAVDEYCDCSYGSGDSSFTLNGLIGALTREIKQLNKALAMIQEEWEHEGTK